MSHSLNPLPHSPSPFKVSLLCFPFSLFISFLCALLLLYLRPLPSWLFNHMRLSAESTKLLKESESQGEFHQPRNNIRRQKEISSQPATSNHLTVRLCLMYVEVIFFFHSDETRQELPKVPPLTCYFHLLLTSLNSTSLASPVVSWKRVTFSQNSLQSRENETTFILRYHVLQSKLRVSFLIASTINFPRLSKQQAIGQQREPSLQKSTHPSQPWVHFISPFRRWLCCYQIHRIYYVLHWVFFSRKNKYFQCSHPFLQKVSPAFQVGGCQVTLGKSEVPAYGWGSFRNAKLAWLSLKGK